MVSLERMTREQFVVYCDYFVADYAVEIAENYRKTKAQAEKLASEELQTDLPDGVDTKDHVLLCIHHGEGGDRKVIGYLWYRINKSESNIFLLDFFVFPHYRGMGYGKRSLALLEKTVAEKNIGQIRLRVAYSNTRAFALYKELGYEITGFNMAKNTGIDEI